jgi:hypothetical protein
MQRRVRQGDVQRGPGEYTRLSVFGTSSFWYRSSANVVSSSASCAVSVVLTLGAVSRASDDFTTAVWSAPGELEPHPTLARARKMDARRVSERI